MKKLFIYALCILPVLAWSAAEEPVLISHDSVWNYFLQPELSYGEIYGENAGFAGLRLGAALDDQWGIGLGGSVLLNDLGFHSRYIEDVQAGDLWYAGLLMEYHMRPNCRVDVALGFLVGIGEYEVERIGPLGEIGENFVVYYPSLDLTVKLTDTLELGAGFGYRLIDEANDKPLLDRELEGPEGRLFLRFNEF